MKASALLSALTVGFVCIVAAATDKERGIPAIRLRRLSLVGMSAFMISLMPARVNSSGMMIAVAPAARPASSVHDPDLRPMMLAI